NLAMFGEIWPPIVRFAAEGLIIPITKYVKSRNLNVNEMFYQSEIESMWWKGELYSTPMPTAGGETGLMFIHKPLLQQAGLDPARPFAKPPKTWQELEQAARTTTKRSPAKGIEVMGADVGTNGTAFIAWLYTNNGAFLSDDLRKITFHSEEGVQTLEWMLKFTNEINGGVEMSTISGRPRPVRPGSFLSTRIAWPSGSLTSRLSSILRISRPISSGV
ncbi:MAG: hypothetical protein C4294_11560, partial [Nitrospiraceae bacterium]